MPEPTDEYKAGSESDDYDDVDFGATQGRRGPAPDPGVPINWDLPLMGAATPAGALCPPALRKYADREQILSWPASVLYVIPDAVLAFAAPDALMLVSCMRMS